MIKYVKKKRKIYIKIKNKLKRSKPNRDNFLLNTEERLYKKFIKYKKNSFCKNIHNKLRTWKSANPKEYWKALNFSKNKNSYSVHINDLYKHFKDLNENSDASFNEFDTNRIMINNNNEINSDFTLDEVDNMVNKLKNNKANGIML